MEKNWWMPLYGILFGIYVPEEVRELKGDVVMHIADTPSTVYGAIRRLVKVLSPRWIVHTGDLADDVKLELSPAELPRYRSKLENLRRALEGDDSQGLVIVTGNHDNERAVREMFPKSIVFRERGRIELCGEGFNLSHDRAGLGDPPLKYNLFGHEPSRNDFSEAGALFFERAPGRSYYFSFPGESVLPAVSGYVDDGGWGGKNGVCDEKEGVSCFPSSGEDPVFCC